MVADTLVDEAAEDNLQDSIVNSIGAMKDVQLTDTERQEVYGSIAGISNTVTKKAIPPSTEVSEALKIKVDDPNLQVSQDKSTEELENQAKTLKKQQMDIIREKRVRTGDMIQKESIIAKTMAENLKNSVVGQNAVGSISSGDTTIAVSNGVVVNTADSTAETTPTLTVGTGLSLSGSGSTLAGQVLVQHGTNAKVATMRDSNLNNVVTLKASGLDQQLSMAIKQPETINNDRKRRKRALREMSEENRAKRSVLATTAAATLNVGIGLRLVKK